MNTARPAAPRLPYAVGSIGHVSLVAVVASAAIAIVGVGAWIYQLRAGEVVTGMRDLGAMGGVTWGLYIVFVIYFVGVSFAGIAIAALIRLLDLQVLRPVARMAMVLTVVSLVLAALAVLADLGQPGRGLVNLFRYARPQSPFFGTFTLVIAALLFASLVYLYLDGRRDANVLARQPTRLRGWFQRWAAGYEDTPEQRSRHERVTFWLALAIVPLLVAALSTEGFVFGIQASAAGWSGALQGPAFVVWGGVSGVGHIIVIAALARRSLRLDTMIPMQTFTWLANLLWILIAVALYFLVAELLTGAYAAHDAEVRVTEALWRGPYAAWLWTTVALLGVSLVLLFGQYVSSKRYLTLTLLAAVLVNVAAVIKRYLIVVPSQTHGRALWYDPGSYAPSWVEVAVVAGLLALGALLMLLFFKVFPIAPVVEETEVR